MVMLQAMGSFFSWLYEKVAGTGGKRARLPRYHDHYRPFYPIGKRLQGIGMAR